MHATDIMNTTAVPRRPADYPRRVLLAVSGLSPQIVTETLYALAVRADPPWIPTEIRLLTTARGAEHARLNLLSAEPGWFHRLRAEYRLPPIRFDADCVEMIRDGAGNPLEDIRSQTDNDATADALTEAVRVLTADPDSALHVSIAGGRKTMGYYLGYALSLFGRAQDRLSHVLVADGFEGHPQFYYPSPGERVIHTLGPSPRPLDCRQAEVTLAEIPFVRLREGLPDALLAGRARFSGTVAALNRVFGPPALTLDLPARRIRAGGIDLVLPPAELAFLSLFARRAKRGEAAVQAPPKGAPDATWAGWYLAERRAIGGELADLDAAERALQLGMDGDYFSQLKSKLLRRLREALGPAAQPYLIDDGGRRPRRYGLPLQRTQVTFAALDRED
ncbi:MAG: CRISPR-associated ring nuclease Csm6 [Pseudomonadota bacterium]